MGRELFRVSACFARRRDAMRLIRVTPLKFQLIRLRDPHESVGIAAAITTDERINMADLPQYY